MLSNFEYYARPNLNLYLFQLPKLTIKPLTILILLLLSTGHVAGVDFNGKTYNKCVQNPDFFRGPLYGLCVSENGETRLVSNDRLPAINAKLAVFGDYLYYSPFSGNYDITYSLVSLDVDENRSILASFAINSGGLMGLLVVDGVVYFSGYQQNFCRYCNIRLPALWRTEGTADTTHLVKEIRPVSMKNLNGTLIFVSGNSLWRSDGTESGTLVIKDFIAQPHELNVTDDWVYFNVTDEDTGNISWKSDGTSAGTIRLTPIVTIDGDFSDWSKHNPVIFDKVGDVASSDTIDWQYLWSIMDDDHLYISYQTANIINFSQDAWRYHVFLDIDKDRGTGYKGIDGDDTVGAEYLVQGGTLYQYLGSGQDWDWRRIGFVTYSYLGNRIEMAIAGEMLSEIPIDGVHIYLYGDNEVLDDRAEISPIIIDGDFSDWEGVEPIGIDLRGDAKAGEVDWTKLWVKSSPENLYLSYETENPVSFTDAFNSSAWGYQIELDTDLNTFTGYIGVYGDFKMGADYLIQGGTLYRYSRESDRTLQGWKAVTGLLYSYLDRRLEIAIPWSSLGMGEEDYGVDIMLYGLNPLRLIDQDAIDFAPDDKAGYRHWR